MREKTQPSAGKSNQEQRNKLKGALLTTSEGRILTIGVVLAFIYTLWLGLKLLFSPEEFQVLVGMTATEIIFGRAFAMAFGYSLDLEHGTVIPICIITETILVLIFYPLFVFSWYHLLVINRLKKTFERIQNTAERHKSIVRSYGIVGLFAFVWFPFWMTGPVVGCVIGFLLGFRVWINLIVVLAGTYVAIFSWAFFLRQFHDRVASYSTYSAMAFIALLTIIIVGHLLYRTIHNNKKNT